MTTQSTLDAPKAGWRLKVAFAALAFSIAATLWLVVAAFGTQWGFWDWKTGLGVLTGDWGFKIAIAALIVGIVAQIISVLKAPRVQPFIVALAATLIAGYAAGRLVAIGLRAASLPPIHDIQTDWSDPIRFSESLMTARNADGDVNPVLDAPVIPESAKSRWPGMEGRLVSEAQEEAEAKQPGKYLKYPYLAPAYFDQSPVALAEFAEKRLLKKGYEIVTPAPTGEDTGEAVQIEATVTSWWFGFKDDLAVRITPVEGASKLDIRSTSRVGLSDLGANSVRISGIMTELKDRADGRDEP